MTEPTRQLGLADLCARLGIAPPENLKELKLTGITTLELAGPTDVSFVTRASFRKQVPASRAGVILAPAKVKIDDPRVLAVEDVWTAILELLAFFHPEERPEPGVHPTAIVSPEAVVGPDASVGAYALIEAGARVGARTVVSSHCTIGRNATLGEDCFLHARVSVARGTEIGNRVILHSGVVIGADGFKYELMARGLVKIPQVGKVVIEDDVEVGANSTIDRASFSETRIGARTKIDNLVQIGHNCIIGTDCIIVAQVGISGSVRIGRGCVIGGQVGIVDNTVIGDGVRIAGKAGIHGNIPSGTEWIGAPAMPAKDYFKQHRALLRLQEVVDYLRPHLKEEKEEE